MKLRESLTFPCSASEVAETYADEDYGEARRATLGATGGSTSVTGDAAGAFAVRSELRMPTDRVPDAVRPFVGSNLTVREEQSWEAPAPDGARRGTMRLDVTGTPAGLTATLELTPGGDASCTLTIDGDLVANVPLLGGKLEKAALPYVSKVLRAEAQAIVAYREHRDR